MRSIGDGVLQEGKMEEYLPYSGKHSIQEAVVPVYFSAEFLLI